MARSVIEVDWVPSYGNESRGFYYIGFLEGNFYTRSAPDLLGLEIFLRAFLIDSENRSFVTTERFRKISGYESVNEIR